MDIVQYNISSNLFTTMTLLPLSISLNFKMLWLKETCDSSAPLLHKPFNIIKCWVWRRFPPIAANFMMLITLNLMPVNRQQRGDVSLLIVIGLKELKRQTKGTRWRPCSCLVEVNSLSETRGALSGLRRQTALTRTAMAPASNRIAAGDDEEYERKKPHRVASQNATCS